MDFTWGLTHVAMEPSAHLVTSTCLWRNVTLVYLPFVPYEPQAAARARGMAHLSQLLGASVGQSAPQASCDVMRVAGLHTAVTVVMGDTGHLLAYATDPIWTRNDPQEAVAELGLFMAALQKSPWGLGCHTFVLPHGSRPGSAELNMHLAVGPEAVDVRLTQYLIDIAPKNPGANAEQQMLEIANCAGGRLLDIRQESCPLGPVTTASGLLTMAGHSARFFARATVYCEHRSGAICEITGTTMTSHGPEPQAHHALMRVMMALGAPL